MKTTHRPSRAGQVSHSRTDYDARLLRCTCSIAAALMCLGVAHGQADPNDMGAPPASPPRVAGSSGSGAARRSARTPGLELSAELTRRLWESRIASPDANEDAEVRDDLDNLIQKIRSVRFESNEVVPTFAPPGDVTARAEYARGSAVAATASDAIGPPARAAAPAAASARPGPPAALQKLPGLIEDPNLVRHPLEVAELLFLSGRLAEAIPFYERALAQTTRADAATSSDRAWILFQLGNCLRETNMTKANEAYLKLIGEFPNSPWTELAKAHGRLIAWRLATQPEQLMANPSQ